MENQEMFEQKIDFIEKLKSKLHGNSKVTQKLDEVIKILKTSQMIDYAETYKKWLSETDNIGNELGRKELIEQLDKWITKLSEDIAK